jgi:putative solute:sodium symporter small subunit
MTTPSSNQAYWRANLKLGAVLLGIWFVVSFGFGILLVEPLNEITFFGFKLGFWWAQQGSIFVFIALIFVYSALMKRIDRKYGVHDDED